MRWTNLLTLTGALLMLLGCCDNRLDHYTDTKPVMKFDQFFNGPVTGHAIVQDRSGKVIRSFTVYMVGTWEKDKGTLKEHFVYSDGEIQDRVWDIKKLGDNKFEGTANDIIGVASGQSNGQAIQWNYVMNVKVGNSTYSISFDDWMFLVSDDLIINRSIMTKFGIKVGEITISLHKDPT